MGGSLRKYRFLLIVSGVALIIIGILAGVFLTPVGLVASIAGLLVAFGSNILSNLLTNIFDGSKTNEFLKIIKDTQDELKKFQTIIKVKNISVTELIKHYNDPLNGLLILPYNQKIDKKDQVKLGKKLTKEEQRFIGNKLREMGAIGLNGGFYFLPPKLFDQSVRTKEQLNVWLNKEILSKVPNELRYTIVLASIIDLKNIVVEQKKEKPEQWGETLLDMIPPNQLFDREFLLKEIKNKTSIREILDYASPSVFCSEILKQNELKKLVENQNAIFDEIKKKTGGTPTLETYATIQSIDLEEILKPYLTNPKVAAEHIVKRAQETVKII